MKQACPFLRFWSYVQEGAPTECWLWTGTVNRKGYGRLWLGRRCMPAHVFAWIISRKKELPEGKPFGLHTCDNRRCCNPAHIYAGTNDENVADRQRRNRQASTLKKADVLWAKRRIAAGETNVAISRDLKVCPETISKIRVGETWLLSTEAGEREGER